MAKNENISGAKEQAFAVQSEGGRAERLKASDRLQSPRRSSGELAKKQVQDVADVQQDLFPQGDGSSDGQMLSDAQPLSVDGLVLAQAGAITSETPVVPAEVAQAPVSTAGAAAGTAAVAAGATGTTLLVVGGLGLALAGGGGGGGTSVSDTTAPSAPTIDPVSTDNMVNGTEKTAGVTVSGTAEASSTVTVTWGTATKTATTNSSGVWSASFASTDIPADGSYSVSAVARDAAGNTSSAGTLGVAVDTVAPVLALQAVHGNTSTAGTPNTVVLSYDGNLDATNVPATTAFVVTVGGFAVTVNSVSVSGALITLSTGTITSGQSVTVTYTDPTSGNDASATQDAAGNDAATFSVSSGLVADGYVRGARIWIDTDNDGVKDLDTGIDTDAQGNYFLPNTVPAGTIFAIGGFNVDTGVPNTLVLKAPAGSTTVNPLTTLVQAVVEASSGATDATAASATVAASLGITLPSGTSLTEYDPIAAGDVSSQKVAAQVATIATMTGDADTVIGNLVQQIGNATNTSSTVNLSDATTVSTVVQGVSTTLSTEDLSAIADASSAISSATTLSDIAQAQSEFLDMIAPASPTAIAAAAATNDTTPVVRVSFSTSITDGTAAVAGDTVVLRDNGVQIASVVLSAANFANGYVDITAPVLAEGVHTLTALISDQAGNAGSVSSATSVRIDTLVPSLPTVGVIATDDVINTSETSSVISGVAEAGASVVLTLGVGNARTVTAHSSTGAWSYILQSADITAMQQGPETINVVATDAAGNSSTAATRSISIDTAAPSVTASVTGAGDNVLPTTGNIATGGSTNDNTLDLSGTVSGSLGSGEVVAVYDGSTRLGAAAVTGTAWTFTTASLSNSSHSFTARVEDAAGNRGTAGAAYTLTVNATVPTATVSITGVTDDFPSGSASVTSGGSTNDTTPILAGSVTGTLASGDVVVVYDGTVRLGLATVSGSTWSYAPSALSAGTHAFKAVVEASGGNQGAASSAYTVIVDSTAPNAPAINVVATDDQISASEKTASVTVSGTAEASATVAVTWGSSSQSVTASAAGSWSASFAGGSIPADGTSTITAVATDAAGNASTSSSRSVFIDATTPGLVSISSVAGDNAINAAELAGGVSVSGTADNGTTVVLNVAGNDRAVAVSSGAWSYALTDADVQAMGTSASLTAKSVDALGNTGSTTSLAVTLDTKAPALTAFALSGGSDTGVQGDGRSNDTTPAISFTAESGAAVSYAVGSGAFTSAGTGTGSAQSINLSALGADGAYTITVKAVDAVGNATTRTGSYVLDTTAPVQATIGTVGGNGVVNASERSAGVSVSGTAEPGASVAVAWGASSKTVNANASGAWSTLFAAAEVPADGSTTITVTATDAAGNAATAATIGVTVDTVAPANATISTAATDNRVNASEKAAGVTVTGTAEAGSSVAVSWGSTTLSPVTANASGVWSASFTGAQIPADGSSSISATATDAAGNSGTAVSRAVTIDTQSPAVPTIGAVATDNMVNAAEKAATVTLSGTAEANSQVTVVWGSTTQLANVSSSGNWSSIFATSAVPADGSTTVTVTSNDSAGNVSSAATVAVTVDTTVPTATTAVTGALDDQGAQSENIASGGTTNDQSLGLTGTVNGTLGSGEVVAVYDGTARLGAASVSSGAWSFATSNLTNGTHSFTARVEDAAGNQGTAASAYSVVVDATVPTSVASVTGAADDVAAHTGSIVSGGLTNDTLPVISGSLTATLASGELVRVYDGTTSVGAATVNGTAWSLALSNPLTDGTHSFTARVENAGGNQSTAGTGHSLLVDATAPAAPVVGVTAGNDVVNASEKSAGVTVTGTAEAGSSVAVSWGSTTLSPVTANASGVWSASFAGAQLPADGSTTITVVATDAAGNSGSAGTRSVVIDSAAVGVPEINVVAGDDKVSAAEKSAGLTVTGLATAGSSVAVSWGSTTLSPVAANASGVWSVNFGSAQIPADGAMNVSAVATSTNGNTSSAGTRSVTIDTSAPATPVINAVATDNTVNASEKAAGVTVTGTVEAGSSVAVSWGSTTLSPVTANASGVWSASFAGAQLPADGGSTVSATATDAAGNASSAGTRSVTIDTSTATPVINAVATDNTVNASEKAAGVTVTGTVEAGSSVAVSWGSTTLSPVTANASGVWSASFTGAQIPADGSSTVSATATDAAGNASSAGTRSVSIDTTVPATPVLSTIEGDDKINAAEKAAGITISGTTTEADGTITVSISTGTPVISKTVTATGATWSATFASGEIPADGSYSVYADVTDAAGNKGGAASKTLLVDTSNPSATVSLTGAEDNVGATQGNVASGGTTDDNTLTLSGSVSGTLESGLSTSNSPESVRVLDGATLLGTASVVSGTWSFTTSGLSNATHSFTAQVADGAGNTSAASSAYVVTVNAVVPTATAAVTGVEDNVSLHTGNVSSGGTTNDSTVVISGTISGALNSGDTVVLYDTALSQNFGTATLNGSNWTFTAGPLADGTHGFKAAVMSATGVVGSYGTTYSVAVDTGMPNQPVFNAVTGDDVITAAEQTSAITGTAEPGATVNLVLGSNTRTVLADASTGAWNYSLVSADISSMGQGNSVSISATAVDAAGNTSATTTRTLSIDTVAPAYQSAAVNGSSLVMTFDGALDASHPPLASNFTVMVNSVARTVSGVSVSGSTVTLTLVSAVSNGDTVTVAYADPTSGNDTSAIQDAVGNDMPGLTASGVTNNTSAGPVNDAPVFWMLNDGRVLVGVEGYDFNTKDVLLQGDGKIVLPGGFNDNNPSNFNFSALRLTADGRLDTSFDVDGTAVKAVASTYDEAMGGTVLSDGKILLVGQVINTVNNYDFCLVRFNADGSLDTGFGSSGVTLTAISTNGTYDDDKALGMAVQSDGKIVVVGSSQGMTGNSSSNTTLTLVRYNSDGSLDTTFDTDGKVTNITASSVSNTGNVVKVLSDGKILVGGVSSAASNDFTVWRFNSNGSIDTTFGTSGAVKTDINASSNDSIVDMAVLTNGNILVLGNANVTGSTGDIAIARYSGAGVLDTTFGTSGKVVLDLGLKETVSNIAVFTDGKFLVTGVRDVGGTTSTDDLFVMRFNASGTQDSTFGNNGLVTLPFTSTAFGGTSVTGTYVEVQSDGKILLSGGVAGSTSGTQRVALVRLNADGTLDGDFGSTATYKEGGSAVVLDADVSIGDAELTLADNFNGASLTLARHGGANSQDVFSASGTLGTLTTGSTLSVGGTAIGTVTSNSNGSLQLAFNSSATQALVNKAIQQIAYSNTSLTPPASVQIDWVMNDGNTTAQGSGGALTASGHTTVMITDVPTLTTASVNGASLTLSYDEALDSAHAPQANAFTVTVNGTTRSVAGVSVSGSAVTLTLGSAVASGDTVTVAYADPTSGDDVSAVQDAAGNDALNQAAFSVTNNTSAQAVSTTATINWTTVDNGPVVMHGEKVAVQVHFKSNVTITGTPTLSLVITDDSNVAHTVNASFVPWTQGQTTVTQSSMKFEYTIGAGDVGQLHIGSISLPSGASVVDAANTSLAADLTLTDSLRTIGELQTYLYGGTRTTTSATGSADSDLLTYYIDGAGKGSAPSNGTFSGINGGDGTRDVLGVPILLPNTVANQTQADGYSMRFNSSTSTIEVLDSTGAVVSGGSSVVPATGGFPAGVEVLVYFLQWRDPNVTDVNASGAYKDADAGEMVFSAAVAQIDGKVVTTDHFVVGTANSDTINKSADTNTASRYFIRSGEGNDSLTGSSGADSFRAGGGDDFVDGGSGNDAMFAERGVDTFDGGAGTDAVILQVQGMQPALLSRFSGPAIGSQTGTWSNGVFTSTSTAGEYRLRADDGGNLIVKDFSTDGTIVNTTAANIERIQVRYEEWDGRTFVAFQNGSSGSDTLTINNTTTSTSYTFLNAQAGDDNLTASNNGNDVLWGGSGNDTLTGGSARDLLYGGTGTDNLTGNGGNDFLFGGAGNDTLSGGGDSFSGTWNASTNAGDAAGFVVNGTGTSALSYAYDSALGGIAIRQGANNLAKLTYNSGTSTWTVQDLAGSNYSFDGNASFHGGTDTVTGVETFVFDYAQSYGNYSLSVAAATLQSALSSGSTSDYTTISGSPTTNQAYVMTAQGPDNDVVPTVGTTMTFKVYMSTPVTVSGSPNLQLVIGDAANHKTVLATYDSAASTANGATNLLVFNYTFGANDTGQLAIGNLYLPSGTAITGNNNNGPAFLRIDDTSNIQANAWVYATPGQTATTGNDWIFNPSNVDVSDAAKLTTALNSISAGTGGDRDLLDLRLAGAGALTHSEVTNGYQVSMAGRTFQILNEAGSVNLYEMVNNTPTMLKSITGLGFEKLKLTHVDANDAELESGVLTLVQGVFDDAIRNVQLVEGTSFADTINRSGAQSKYQIIWSDSGNDTVTGSDNGDSIDINEGTDTINAGGGNDFLAWHDAGTATVDGGTGTDTIRMFAGYVPGLSGTTTYQFEGDGKVHVRVGGTDAIVIEKAASGAGYEYKLISSQDSAGQNNMIAQVSNMETLSLSTQTSSTDIAFSAIAALFPSSSVSTTAKINWTVNDSGPAVEQGGEIFITVHFASNVVITGVPKLMLTITNDSGQSHDVEASFSPSTTGQSSVTQSSMEFVYNVTSSDVGRFHIGNIVLPSGVTVMDAANTSLAADLTMTDSLKTIGTLQTYLYGGTQTITGQTGTSGNDLILYYADGAGQGNAPTDGVFTGVDGGAGGRDVLGVPVLLPSSVNTDIAAAAHYLRYNSSTGNIEAVNAGGTVVTTSAVPAPANYPSGIEVLVYFIQWVETLTDQNNVTTTVYHDSDDSDDDMIVMTKALYEVSDAVTPGDTFVAGSQVSDTIDKSSDTSTTTRYLIRGGEGNDTITGHAGSDYVIGGGGNDTITTGAGSDLVFVSKGTDTADLGGDSDSVVVNLGGQQMGIRSNFTGPSLQSLYGTWNNGVFTSDTTKTVNEYRLSVNANGDLMVRDYSTIGSVTHNTFQNVENIQIRFGEWDGRNNIPIVNGTTASEHLVADGARPNFLTGRDGDDVLSASTIGYDMLMGGGGNDALYGNTARDLMYGGAGNDYLRASGGNDFLFGGTGNDILDGGTDGGGTWGATTNSMDTAGFHVHANGQGTAQISLRYDASQLAYFVVGTNGSGTLDMTKITRRTDGRLVVEDLSDSSTNTAHSGTDVLGNIETLTFDYTSSTGSYSLAVEAAGLDFPTVSNGTTSSVTKINWTNSGSAPVITHGDDLEIQVHFTNPVTVTGTPTMSLTIEGPGGNHNVTANYTGTSGLSSLVFTYTATSADVGGVHINGISLPNGAAITESATVGGLAADLTLNASNLFNTAGLYFYGGTQTTVSTTGSSGNDAMMYYIAGAGAASLPTDGVYTGINGGDGTRDVLGVPIMLPSSVTSQSQADAHVLRYNATNGTLEAVATSNNTVTTSVTVGSFPTGIEAMVFLLKWKDGSNVVHDVNSEPIIISSNLVSESDPVNANDITYLGTLGADTVDVSSDASTATRYFIRTSVGNDTIVGHAGVDVIRPEGGNDSVSAGAGNDAVFMSLGTDTALGGEGTDKVILNLAGQDLGFRGNFTGPSLQSQYGTWSNGVLTVTSTVNEYRLGTDDTGALIVRDYNNFGNLAKLTANEFEQLEVRMGGSDVRRTIPLVFGTSGADTIGADGLQPSFISSGAGDDVLTASAVGNDMLMGGGGNDTLNGGAARDYLYGGSGNDAIYGQAGNDYIFGGGGDDTILGGADFGGAWSSTSNVMDSVGFFVSAGGASGTNTTLGTAALTLSAFNTTEQAYFVRGTSSSGTVDVAKITKDVNGNLILQDLSSSANNSAHSGTDTVSGVETLLFDYTSSGSPTTYFLALQTSTLTFL